MHFDSQLIQTLFYVIGGVAAIILLILGYKFGGWMSNVSSRRLIASKENELFTAQRGFKNLYEQELSNLRRENENLKAQMQTLNGRVEEYRKKAAGFGGLFSSGGKKADAMYALLLENEALEEALYSQNEKLKQERTDSLKEQMRATGYRRVLMSQLLNDQRIKDYVAEILADERHLPSPSGSNTKALPPERAQTADHPT
jgi:cell division protein FtsB